MKRPVTRGVAFTATSAFILAAAFCAAVPQTFGQAAPAAAPAPTDDEEIIELSPFTVSAQEDKDGYAVKDTLAGSRIRTDLTDVGSAISVVNKQFLQDTGARNNQDLLTYTANTEVAGNSGNFAGVGTSAVVDDNAQRMNPNSATRVRGLTFADNTRDFFLTDIPWDGFNVGRVDLQRGPNSMLFGIGSPAGIINTSLNPAAFKDEGKVELRYGSYDSVRASLDYNKSIIKDELAIRLDLLDDYTQYRQQPAFNRDRRIYGALRYDPKFLRFDGARTSIKVNYEKGEIKANRPRILPPVDMITPWYKDPQLIAIRKAGGFNPATVGIGTESVLAALRAAGDMGAGIRSNTNGYFTRKINGLGRNYGGLVSVFEDPTTSDNHLYQMEMVKDLASYVSIPWTIMSGVAPTSTYAQAAGIKNASFYKDERLSDASIFDFYNNLLDGPNKSEWSNHEAFNIDLSQTFFNNKLGFNFVFDKQQLDRGQANLMSEYGQAITLDLNNHLLDGTVNPNYGRAVISSDQYANYSYASDREAMRFTGFGELNTKDIFGQGLLSRILGRHNISAMVSRDKFSSENRSWLRYVADATYGEYIKDKQARNRTVNTLNYLNSDVDLTKVDTLSGAYISGLTALQQPTLYSSVKTFNTTWTQKAYTRAEAASMPWTDANLTVLTQASNPANYAGWRNPDDLTKPSLRTVNIYDSERGARDANTTSASKARDIIKSAAVNWQGYFWDGVFVPSVGIRKDWQSSYNKTASKYVENDTANLIDGYELPRAGAADSGRSTSWSFVLHTPKSIRAMMPADTGLTLFYSRSSNFRPASARSDVLGRQLPNPQGNTKDYGFLVETLNNKLSLKVTWYETNVQNDSVEGFGNYMLGYGEAWAYNFAYANLDRWNTGWPTYPTGYNPLGMVNALGDFTDAQKAEAAANGDAISRAFLANQPIGADGTSKSFYDIWQINYQAVDAAVASGKKESAFIAATVPATFAATGDTSSKGVEFEVTGQPTKNWNISVNASKTSAKRTNLGGTLVNWVESRWAVYNTPVKDSSGNNVIVYDPVDSNNDGKYDTTKARNAVVGDVRFWDGSYNPTETLRGKFMHDYMANYWLARLSEGSNVAELRPWRFNLVTNYNFDANFLKGVNVGGALRWQDKIVVGYPILDGATAADPLAYDLKNPYYGKSETNVDLWVGYQRKLTKKIDWRVQLNLRNVTSKCEVVPVSVQPDGSLAVGRITEGFGWTLSNTFSF